MIHHYTTIENLALILDSKKIRFTRLDKVDDIIEGTLLPIARYLFVSCWTQSKEENIALWHMYAKGMKGIKLSFPSNPFNERHIKKGKYGRVKVLQDIIKSPLELNELDSSDYNIWPIVDFSDFFNSVMYLNDEQLGDAYKKMLKTEDNTITVFTQKLGLLKHERWKFQDESRYLLKIFPPYKDSKDLVELIHRKEPPKFGYFDLEIDQNKLSNMEITLGPNCTIPDKIIVNSLLKNYGINSTCHESKLKGLLRTKD